MHYRRGWVCVFLFLLTTINYADRVALSVAAKPISVEFGLTPVEMGYLLSSFLWMYVVCLVPVGCWSIGSAASWSTHSASRCGPRRRC
jgi:sugar phosphate permease